MDFSNNFYELENQNARNQKLAIFVHLCVELALLESAQVVYV